MIYLKRLINLKLNDKTEILKMSKEQKSAEKSVAEGVEPVENKASAEYEKSFASDSLSGTEEPSSPKDKSNAQSSPEAQQEKAAEKQDNQSQEKPKSVPKDEQQNSLATKQPSVVSEVTEDSGSDELDSV